MPMRIIFISAAAALLFGIAACGSDEGTAADGPRIVATTGVVADIAAKVAGPDVQVEQVIPDGASPHDFELSAGDRHTLEEADLVVVSGAGLEVGVPLDRIDSPQWTLTEHAGRLRPFEEAGIHGDDDYAEDEGEDGEDHAEDEDAHGDSDPHVWMDPTRVAEALPALADALAEADPGDAAGYRKRADRYAKGLRDLDAELAATLDAIPEANRELVTSHDAFGYFADRYGLEVIATAFPASGPEAEASAALIADVQDAVRSSGVPAVFAQQEDNPATLALIARETGVAIEDGLIVESPASAGSYEAMLRRDAELIAKALGTR